MYYDPVKNIFANIIRKFPFLRILFYKVLDLMFLRSWYVRNELKKLRVKFKSSNIDIYDAGSGFGQYTYFMSKKMSPSNIYSVDVKEDWIKDCKGFFSLKRINNVSFATEDLTKINHQNKFDLILCVDVMEHIEDDLKVFNNFLNSSSYQKMDAMYTTIKMKALLVSMHAMDIQKRIWKQNYIQ